MRDNRGDRNDLILELNRAELEIINNALNEVCHGLDIEEFPVRMGASKPEVLRLLHRVNSLLVDG